MTQRNLGRFELSKNIPTNQRIDIMNRCTVIDSEQTFRSLTISYLALSDQFEPSEGDVPNYEWVETDGKWQAIRQD